ncbi:unnamed protein product [Trichobilharzia szidati]|nr:unnamed protein product [Trichobilharzia szidati]
MFVHLSGVLIFLQVAYAIEQSRGALGPRIFTFVHGDEAAKLNFSAAEDYCRNSIGKNSDSADQVSFIDVKSSDHLSAHALSKTKDGGLILQTSLASIHSYPENTAIIKWVSQKEKNSFWIGGQVTKTMNEFLRSIYVLHWTDGSKSDFSLLRLPNPELTSMVVGEHRCISVDYSSGQWGVHLCSEKKYFICLTVPVFYPEKEKNFSSHPQHKKFETVESVTGDELENI